MVRESERSNSISIEIGENAIRFPPEVLTTVWRAYLTKYHYTADVMQLQMWGHSYNFIPRRGSLALKFENWLFEQGGQVMQINRKRYLEFSDGKQASIFMLKWGTNV